MDFVNLIRSIPLVGTVPVSIMVAVLVIAAIGAFFFGTLKRNLVSVALAAAITVVVWLVLSKWWKPFPDAVPFYIYLGGGAAIFVLVRTILNKGKRIAWLVVFLAAALCAGGLVNVQFNVYRTVGDIRPMPVTVTMDYNQFSQTTSAPQLNGREVGAEVTIPLEATKSSFHPRDAIAYVPPAYWTKPDMKFPVIVLLPGNPGSPDDWFKTRIVQQIADEYQQAHDGVSPIVVSVDGTGGYLDNPACVDGARGNVQTYLAVDVPNTLKAKLRVTDDQSTWTIGGLSYGGTCSLQVVTNAPQAYGNFLDFSGQAEPTLNNHQDTVDTLFGGSEDAFNAIDPAHILTAAADSGDSKFSNIQGKFIAGTRDSESQKTLSNLNDLAQKAGMTTDYGTVSGGHDFGTWRKALDETFDWAASRGGLG